MPKENARLHYRVIGFSFPVIKGADNYIVEIATGNYNADEAFNKSIILSKKAESGKQVIEVPSFGKEYTWRTVCNNKGTNINSSLHHFSCIISSGADTNVTRLRILQKAAKYKDAYVFMDGSKAIYDMDGNPVWYVPGMGKANTEKSKLWDMKLTPQGTITFLLDQNIYEINYDGDVLWKGPNNGKVSGDSIEYYHHELMKLTNGHYMVLGTEFTSWAGNGQKTNDTNRKKAAFGTLIEYDHDGNVVWSWKSSQYFKSIDPKYLTTDFYDIKGAGRVVDVHENAFYFDEKEQVAYISFKDISSIIRVKYPEGNVLNVYGKLAKSTKAETKNDWFCGQHSCKTTSEGNLYLYNNNACHKDALPQILMFEQPETKDDTLRKIWEYTCSFEDVLAEKQAEAKSINNKEDIPTPEMLSALNIYSKGGNLVSLPDHSIFASICGIYGKVFIITSGKETVWSALLEIWNPYQRKWEDVINYKANIILDRTALEKLIWNTGHE